MKNQLFNRKNLFSLLAVVMCLGWTAMSYGQAVVSVVPAEVPSPAAGEELTVSINIAGGADVAGYQVTVNFDPTALSYVSSANADYLPAGAFPTPPIKTESSVKVAAASLTGAAAATDGTLATVTFMVVEAKASTIELTDVILAGADGPKVEATTANGMVTVASAEGDDTTEGEETEGDETEGEETEGEETEGEETEGDETEGEETEGEETEGEETEGDETEGETTEPAMPTSQMFEVTLTNLTTGEVGAGGQILSPPIFVAHPAGINLAPVGEAATEAIVLLAEGGDTSGLAALATAAGASSVNADGVVPPGGSATVTVTADAVNSSLSVGAMLVSTNDGFIALTDFALFGEDGAPVTMDLELSAYDAGSEENTEMASDIPGPVGLDEAADPEGSNARVPTEGGVIAAHPGIQGVGDVGEAFAWTEPTAMLTITPVSAPTPVEPVEPVEPTEPVEPVEPVVTEPTMPAESGFDVALEAGLNMISIPLMPEEPYTAKSLADMLGSTIVIKLDATTQSFVGYTVAEGDDGFAIDGGRGYIVNTPAGGVVTFTGSAWSNPKDDETTEPPVAGPDDGGTTPPADENGGTTPPVADNGDTTPPADDGGDTTPPVADGAGNGETTPPADDTDGTTPPADDGGETTPPVADGAGNGETTPPADDTGGTTPPADDGGETTPPVADGADNGDTTVANGADGADNGDTTPPANGETGDEGGDDATPPANGAANGENNGAPAAPALATYKSAWAFIVTSDLQGMEPGASYTIVAENLRTGAVARQRVSSDVKRSSAVWADLNRKSVVDAGDKVEIALHDARGAVVSGPFQRTVTTTDIRNAFLTLQLRVGDVQPKDTILAQNFPNPFNPETWIPYQLNKATEVTIHIYDASGRLVRTLELGWQPTGSYMTASSAAYWDGRNEVGERVASGIYFYTLQTQDFTATRKMVILK